MADTRQKRHPAAFKAKVALEAVKQTRTLAELARAFPVHTVRISQWKKQLLDGAESLFGHGRRREQAPSRTLSSAPKSAGAPQDGQSLKAGPTWLDPTWSPILPTDDRQRRHVSHRLLGSNDAAPAKVVQEAMYGPWITMSEVSAGSSPLQKECGDGIAQIEEDPASLPEPSIENAQEP